MQVKVTYFLEVISSWCYWAEPAWAELKRRYASAAEFDWRIALMDNSGLPRSRAQLDWFYRRSGTAVGSPFMLNGAWFEPGRPDYLAPNALAEAARELGVTDDRVRLALANAALREGLQVGRWEVAGSVAARAAGVPEMNLVERAQSSVVADRLRASTTDFYALQASQRPAFLIESQIGDRAVFSGLARIEPLAAAIDAMLADCRSYAAWKAHFGEPPRE